MCVFEHLEYFGTEVSLEGPTVRNLVEGGGGDINMIDP